MPTLTSLIRKMVSLILHSIVQMKPYWIVDCYRIVEMDNPLSAIINWFPRQGFGGKKYRLVLAFSHLISFHWSSALNTVVV